MRILHKDLKAGKVKVKIETLDDLWYLSSIIEEKDHIAGPTERKIKIEGGSERNQSILRKTVFIEIEVEKVEFHTYSTALRVSGKITACPDDVSRGSYHTFSVEQGTEITIRKEQWLQYQFERLKEAAEAKNEKILLCLVDREEAHFALLKRAGYEYLLEMKGEVQKKANPEKIKTTFYPDVVKQIEEYEKRFGLEKIIVASPGFWKEYLQEQIKNKAIVKKIMLATCHDVSKAGFEEVLKRPETATALKENIIVKEMLLVEEIFKEVMKEGAVSYGIKEVKKAAEQGAVQELIVADVLIQKMRQDNTFGTLDWIMKIVDRAKGNVHIISTEHAAGKKLDGLGGIAALLRYKM